MNTVRRFFLQIMTFFSISKKVQGDFFHSPPQLFMSPHTRDASRIQSNIDVKGKNGKQYSLTFKELSIGKYFVNTKIDNSCFIIVLNTKY